MIIEMIAIFEKRCYRNPEITILTISKYIECLFLR